jgi:hypothetical protein
MPRRGAVSDAGPQISGWVVLWQHIRGQPAQGSDPTHEPR